ncbi:uncharacterized protein I303_100070 [Kwoniella dejecticola CBS 10117]|uniref:Uncharacterized protein n=1 Tax=Kwoniella dejecticola CBS 10117 TaxID=1296121 RepID=A0A1A6ADZ4_9TREE|nr:uncharacterized protein I303_00070 [Kwoniella dejecticola CBS 10117]OBR88259.1 hypothetical protein I303_00070 [Kwoniella dejecticola CBS 10117]
MPLYKLTERRMQKRAREDEDGITEIKAKMREMGENVDGSESEGWSESESDTEDDENDDDDHEDDEEEEEDENEDIEIDVEGLESGSEEDNDGPVDDDDDGQEEEDNASSSSSVFPISLESALTEPIYPSPRNPSEQLCVLCPDKALKSDQMIQVHLGSKGHKRSLKRYSIRLTTNPPEEGTDPREVVESILEAMDAGEQPQQQSSESESKSKSESKSQVPQQQQGIHNGNGNASGSGNGIERKRKRRNEKERKIAKAEKLLSAQKVTTTAATVENTGAGAGAGGLTERSKEEGTTEGEVPKLNRKARRLLGLQNGEIEKKLPESKKISKKA